jgi:hypothetical protein
VGLASPRDEVSPDSEHERSAEREGGRPADHPCRPDPTGGEALPTGAVQARGVRHCSGGR